MAASEVQICNMALQLVGVSKQIADFNEQSKEAGVAKLHYEQTRDWLLEQFPWPFAMRQAVLAASTSTRTDWAYVYPLPSDCIAPRKLRVAQSTLPLGYVDPQFATISVRAPQSGQRVAFDVDTDVAADGSTSTVLLTDASAPTLHYTSRVAPVGRFPPAFVEALVAALAMKFAMPLAVSQTIQGGLLKIYQAAINIAISSVLRSRQEDPPPDSEFVTVRG